MSVIVDAAFLCGEERRLFAGLAAQQRAKFVIVSCQAAARIMAERIEQRRQARVDPSDADVSVLDRQLRNWQPLRPDELAHTVTTDTNQPCAYETALAAILKAVGKQRRQ